MAISTYKTFLMHDPGEGTYEKLVDIKTDPDLGGDPEMIDITTMSDKMQRNINGIQKVDALKFTTNYDKADFQELKALEGKEEKYAVWFGGTESLGSVTPTGTEGKFNFTGQLSVYVAGGGVNEARNMNITIANSTEITPEMA